MKNIQALDKRVFVKQEPPKTTIAGNFKIPESSQFRPNRGVVVSKGVEVDEIEVGDTVLFDGAYGLVMEENGEMFRMLEKKNIFAYIKNK